MDDLPRLSDAEFRYITGILYSTYGISLGGQKRTLVAGRLAKRIRQLGLAGFGGYMERLQADPSELCELANHLSTNHTYFFREMEHFRFLTEKVLNPLRDAPPGGRLRIWSAGCSSGEEPYSIAMLLKDKLGPALAGLDAGILATDVSLPALKTAVAGAYPAARIGELPPGYLGSYFRKTGEDEWTVAQDIKALVLYKRLNLMEASIPFRGNFDVIFCRNVMIYFDQASRDRVIATFVRYLRPGGYLFVGHSETIARRDCPLEYIKPAIYRKGA